MLTLNLFDNNFKHVRSTDGLYSAVGCGKQSNYIQYVHNKNTWDGITIFTDSYLRAPLIASVDSKYKIGWIMERIDRQLNNVESFISELDFVMTNNTDIIKNHPKQTKFMPFGGSWIQKNNQLIHKKSQMCSMIYSNKKSQIGHQLRHTIASTIQGVHLYGEGANNPIKIKDVGLMDYMFSIVVENVQLEGYFTEKIIDSLLMGTIPIYWGMSQHRRLF